MPDLKLIFIIEEVRGIIRSITIEVSRILRKDTQILIRRNKHDFDGLSAMLRNDDLPILESLRTCGLSATPYEIFADDFVNYPFSVYSQLTNQFYIRRQRGGGVKPATVADLARIPMKSTSANVGILDGCDILSRVGVRGLSCTVYFRYSGCACRLPFAFTSVPLKNEDEALFLRDAAREKELINDLVSCGVILTDKGTFTLSYDSFKDLSSRLSANFRFLTAKNQVVKTYLTHRSSSGLEWFGDVDELASTDVVDAYLSGRRYVTVDDSIIVADRGELAAATRRAVEIASRETATSESPLFRLFEDLRQLERMPRILSGNDWFPNKAILNAELKDYQIDGVRWIRGLKQLKIGGVLADEMGLGKTVQLLGACAEDMLSSDKPSIIIAPASVVENWHNEISRFVPSLVSRIVLRPEDIRGNSLCVLSYERVRAQSESLRNLAFSHLIVDEGQKIKNAKTISYQTLVGLVADFRMVLTGTPIENNVQELWNHIGFIDPLTIGCFKELCRRYPILESVEKRDRISLLLLSPFVLARKKKDVLHNFPLLKEEIVYCQMDEPQRCVYERIRRSFLAALKNGKSVSVPSLALEALLRLRECCCHPSILPVEQNSRHVTDSVKFNWVYNYIAKTKRQSGKVLIFSQFVTVLDRLKQQIESQGVKCFCLTGGTSKRQMLIDDFNTYSGSTAFLCSIKAGGFGINLTSANEVVLMDPWWNPAVEQQAYARAHRIGQKRDVRVFKLICKNTVEEQVVKLQEQKRKLADGLGYGKLKVSEMIDMLRLDQSPKK